ncbi:hypothetical protein PB01_17385 [Psychrobacillus glaciei]|uniref:YobI-like P-loop NTPase domain-containing protein n=1 Tax=Psychrobacillus glaciei TaxID=2283160 RepID=A0A5J6SR39_9BACI|nr:hypothetical protein [Psychrobacillus glaciei]QFG00432.1 hypothetical protein PB01_17385 [Psychrobacillus glaciei]
MNDIKFQSLVPKKNIDKNQQVYIDAIEWALENKENKNIAITGAYGAGKSTIIDTYIERKINKKSEVLKIAIATFKKGSLNSELENNTIDNDSPALENVLEQQILHQMFYKVKPNKIPNSKFTKLNELSFLYVMTHIIGLLLMILLTFFMLKNNWIMNTYNSLKNNTYGIEQGFWILLGVILAILLYSFTIYKLILVFRKIGVSKFGVGSTSIEFNFKDGSTVFNHYLDEIIYLFSKTKFKYIIFEDLDRFESMEIFERLRGLNTILNGTEILKKRDIRFIYALGDDVFSDEDESDSVHNRTKFFDFIIPIVKVIHSSNAENILLKELKNVLSEDGLQEDTQEDSNNKLSRYLVMDIALYINDMRTLINICNEFEVFRKALITSGITLNHLFAFIVYKNIYPKDYSHLLVNKGLVYDVFHMKDKLIKQCKDEIRILEDEMDRGFGTLIVKKEDIPILFINRRNLLNHDVYINESHVITITNNNVNTGNTLFASLLVNKNSSSRILIRDSGSRIEKHFSLDEWVVVENPKFDYLKAYEDFDSQEEKRSEKYKESINKNKKKIEKIKIQSVSSLLINENLDIGIDFTDKKLLYFLIRNNWLNESYEEYITYFYPGTLSENDNKFLQSIRIGLAEEQHLNLKNIVEVTNRIRLDDINTNAVLNFEFVCYLIENENVLNKQKLQKIINLIFKKNEGVDIDFYWTLLEKLTINNNKQSLGIKKLLITCIECGVDIWKDIISLSVPNEKNKSIFCIY